MLKTTLHAFVNESLQKDIISFSYAKNLIGIFFITLFMGPLFAYFYFYLNFNDAALIIILETNFICLSVLTLKFTNSIPFARNLIVSSLIIALTWLIYRLGGIFSPHAYWLILPPLVAILLGAKRSSILWSALCVAILMVFFWQTFSIKPSLNNPNTIRVLLQAISISGLSVIILALAYFFERSKAEAIQQVELANAEFLAVKDKEISLIKVAESNRLLKSILESILDYSIIAADLNGNILTWNRGAQYNYGYDAEEMIGKKNLRDLMPPTNTGLQAHLHALETALNTDKAEGVYERIRKNGECFLAMVYVSLRRDAENKPIGYLLLSKDMTEKLLLEEQRKINKELDEKNRETLETNRLKNSFLANMSHELRTPLNAILGFSELIKNESLGKITSEQRAGLENITKSGNDLLKLIDDILNLSKIESGKLAFNPKTINVPKFIFSVVNTLQPLFSEKKLTLTTNIDSKLTEIFIDQDRLRQILYNYLTNAIKFTNDHGKIHLQVINENTDFFRIEIEDNGIGIREEDIPKLFIEFQQLDSSSTKKYAGTGLGLSLVKHFVEAQGGQVGVKSIFGEGSVFYAILPKYYNPSAQYLGAQTEEQKS